MKDKNTTWHGIDVSKEVSLLEYNLLVRWDRSKQSFQCIYKIGMDRWGIAFMANREIDQIIMEEWFDLGSFQSFVGIPIGSWISGDFVSKVHNLVSFIGYENGIWDDILPQIHQGGLQVIQSGLFPGICV